jgi:hypothetical protein
MPDSPIIDIESEFSKSFDMDPIDIANHIEKQLQEFVLGEVTSQSSNIYVLERKGFNLFRPYLDQSGKYGVNSIKLLYNSNITRVNCYSANVQEKENILLTDAIGGGKEVDLTIPTLNKYLNEDLSGKNISKVCMYLAKKDGLDELIEKFPSVQFKYLKLATNPTEYREEHNRLFCVYHNRMEPIDGEHPFSIFDVKPLEFGLLKDKIQSVISSIYPGEFSIKDDKLLINSKKAFSVNILNPEIILDKLFWYNPEIYPVDRMQFRFKYDPENCKLRVMALSLVNYNPNMLFKLRYALFGTCFKKLDLKFCKTITKHDTQFNQFVAICCPHCVDWNISQYLLSRFNDALKQSHDILNPA